MYYTGILLNTQQNHSKKYLTKLGICISQLNLKTEQSTTHILTLISTVVVQKHSQT